MLETAVGPWAALLLLGGLHGMNPGMGWLFAVALGLQEGQGRAVWRALPPLMGGHALAVAAAVAVAGVLGLAIAPVAVRWVVAAALLSMGLLQLFRRRHPRYGGMRVGARDLVIWSFLMASAHGAGLMALPFVPTAPAGADAAGAEYAASSGAGAAALLAGHHDHAGHGARPAATSEGGTREHGAAWLALIATLVHTAGYLLVTGIVAVVVYHRVGLRLLRKTWINLDRIWAGALVATALLVVMT
jgi:hypothetical protein